MDLPPEVVLHILVQADIKTTVLFSETCHSYHSLVQNNLKTLIKKVDTSWGYYHIDPKGQKQGLRFFFLSEDMRSKTYYVDDIEHGPFESNHPLETGQYKNGEKDGIWKIQNGSRAWFELWDNGKLTMTQEFSDVKDRSKEIIIAVVQIEGEILFLNTMSNRGCPGSSYPSFSKFTARGDVYQREGYEFFSHCCPKHQKDMPNLFIEKEN